MTSSRVTDMLAFLGLTFAVQSAAAAQAPRVNERYGAVDGWYITRSAQPPSCWVMRSHEGRLWGLSVNDKEQFGLVMLSYTNLASLPVDVKLLDQPFLEEGKRFSLVFTRVASFNSRDFVYEARITNVQLAEVLASKFISFTSLYKANSQFGGVAFASPTGFSDQANAIFNQCTASIRSNG